MGIKSILPKGEFSKNVLTLLTGTTIAQALPISVSPILTRLYSPEDFGVFALFLAICTIFSSIATGRYELAIVLPEKDETAINLAALGLIISTSLATLLLLLIVIFNKTIIELIGNDLIRPWLYFIPVVVLFVGVYNILVMYNTRKKNYRDISISTVIKSVILASTQLAIGLLLHGAVGLISGQILSNVAANFKLLKNILKEKSLLAFIKRDKIYNAGIRYIKFPKYSMWGILANSLSQNYINILISSVFSISTLGFFSLVERVLSLPSALIGKSIGQVFYQAASVEKRETGKIVISFKGTVKKLLIVGIPFFILMFFIVEELFALVFGYEWRQAGEYAKIVIPFFLIRFIVSSISNVNNIFEYQKLALAWQLTLLILSLGMIGLAYYYGFNFEQYLTLMSIVLSLHYIFLYFLIRKIAFNGKLFLK